MGQRVHVRVRDRVKKWDDESFAMVVRKIQVHLMSKNLERAQDLLAAFARDMEPEKRPALELGDSVALLLGADIAGILQRAGYDTISSIKYATDAELLRIKRFGSRRLVIAREALIEHGFSERPKKSRLNAILTAA